MDYTLAILTHGRSRTLDATLRSFMTKVKPSPTRIIVHCDGGSDVQVPVLMGAERFIDSEQRGFCEATRRLWRWAGYPAKDVPEFTFWLEHDFIFLRPVDLAEIAYVLTEDKTLSQMSLMRNAVSREEIAAGGLFDLRGDDYERTATWFDRFKGDPGDLATAHDMYEREWLRHHAYFTTNPSLMRTEFMTWNQWPQDALPECEGRFGIDLVKRGFTFGVWGSGEPWVDHVGRRDGSGY